MKSNPQFLGRGTVAGILRSLNASYELAQQVRQQGYVLPKADMKRTLAELSGHVAEAKMDLNFLQENIQEMHAEMQRLTEIQAYRANLKRKGDAYYRTLESNNKPFGQPFCSYCWEHEQAHIHLHNKVFSKDVRICPKCKNEYQAARTPFFDADQIEQR